MRSPLLFALAALVAIAVIFIAVVASPWSGQTVSTLMLLIGGVPICVAVFWLIKRFFRWLGTQDFFSPFVAFPLGYVVWFAAGSIDPLRDGEPRLYAYVALGLVAYLLGVSLCSRPCGQRVLGCENKWRPDTFWFVIVGLSVLTLASYLYLISHIGLPALSSRAAEQRLEIAEYGPTQAILFTSAFTAMLFVTGHLLTKWDPPWLRRMCWLGLGIMALFMLSLGSRGFLFVPVLTALILMHYLRRRFHLVKLAAVGVSMFIGLSLYGYLRDATVSNAPGLGQGDDLVTILMPFFYVFSYVRQPVATLQDVMELIPQKIPYQHGSLTFGALATVLPGHHEMADVFFKTILGNDFIGGGQPATLLGPFYGDFGLSGILVGMFLLGLLMARLYSWMWAKPTIFRVQIYAWMVQTALLSLFGAIFPYITTLWIPVFWWILDALLLHRPALGPRPRNVGSPIPSRT